MANLENVRVEYSCEVTVNIGNFQNQKPGYRVSADVPAGTHPDIARAKIKALVDGWVESDVQDIQEELNRNRKGTTA